MFLGWGRKTEVVLVCFSCFSFGARIWAGTLMLFTERGGTHGSGTSLKMGISMLTLWSCDSDERFGSNIYMQTFQAGWQVASGFP